MFRIQKIPKLSPIRKIGVVQLPEELSPEEHERWEAGFLAWLERTESNFLSNLPRGQALRLRPCHFITLERGKHYYLSGTVKSTGLCYPVIAVNEGALCCVLPQVLTAQGFALRFIAQQPFFCVGTYGNNKGEILTSQIRLSNDAWER